MRNLVPCIIALRLALITSSISSSLCAEKSFAWDRPAQLITTSMRELVGAVLVEDGLGRWAAKG